MEDVVGGPLGVDHEVDIGRVVELHLGVLHLVLEVSEGVGHVELALGDTAEVDGDLRGG